MEVYFSCQTYFFFAIRLPDLECDRKTLLDTCHSLINKTKYYWKSQDAQAPQKANCVTAIRYVFNRSVKRSIPRVWIGDMVRTLISCGCQLQRVSCDTLQMGDLLFLKPRVDACLDGDNKYISHLVMALGPNQLFHCAEFRRGCAIENLLTPHDNYAKSLRDRVVNDPVLLILYIDLRNVKARHIQNGFLMTLPVPQHIPEPFFHMSIRKIIWEYLAISI